MTDTSPRSHNGFNGLGCSGPVAGWSPCKQRCAEDFDIAVAQQDRKTPRPNLRVKKARRHKHFAIAAE